MADEIEIKFEIGEEMALRQRLGECGFREVTARTHEFNTVYDTERGELRARGELLRLRKYGSKWVLTHKGAAEWGAKHKTRRETETEVAKGEEMGEILTALGYVPRFRYEKYRTEFASADGAGHVVIDETPIGNVGEIEGPAEWIDATAKELGIAESDYITASYSQLFERWRERTGSGAREMTWAEVGS